MHPIELMLRKEADTAREQIKLERRKNENKEARQQINILIASGLDRNEAVNFALDNGNIPIIEKKAVRKAFNYGCYAIYSMAEELSVIDSQNTLDLVLEAT